MKYFKGFFWLFIELVSVSFFCWMILDEPIVSLYNRFRPLGYETEHLMVAQVENYERQASDEEVADRNRQLAERLEQLPEVSTVTIMGTSALLNYYTGRMSFSVRDTTKEQLMVSSFDCGPEHFFHTMGFTPAEGTSIESLDAAKEGVVLTRSLAEYLFGSVHCLGKHTSDGNVAGVIEDVRADLTQPFADVIFNYTNHASYTTNNILIRLKESADPRLFQKKFEQDYKYQLKIGPQFIRHINGMNEEGVSFFRKHTSEQDIPLIGGGIFLLNVLLGTIGTFWIHTRKRMQEIGVRRAFGATKSHIHRMLLGEGFVLTTLSVLLGCLAYFNIAVKNGLSQCTKSPICDLWFTNFSTHFTVVSILIYLLLLTVVSIGIAIPAWRASRTHIVDTLK